LVLIGPVEREVEERAPQVMEFVPQLILPLEVTEAEERAPHVIAFVPQLIELFDVTEPNVTADEVPTA
jgi:hypothetical protein